MARELDMDIVYQQVVGIARRLEGILTREKEERESKRTRESDTYSVTRSPATTRYGRGYVNCHVHSALPAASGIPVTPRPQALYYASSLSSAPPTRDAFSGQSSRSGSSQPQQPHLLGACFECGDTLHMVRDCPRLKRGAPPQTTQAPRAPLGPQAIVTALATTPPALPARGGGRAGKGRPRGGGHARYYALPFRTEAVASDSVITGIISVCHRDTSDLFDPGSTYSYVLSYFALYLSVYRDSLSSHIYVSTLVGDSIVVDRVYRSFLVILSGFETRTNLLLLNMVDFDIILGMYWLSPYQAILDCHTKTVTLDMPRLPRLEWRGTLDYNLSKVISFLKAQRMVKKGCDAYLVYVRDVSVDTPTTESVPIVRDYPNVFLMDLSGIPPERDIDFGIDLLPGTQPISIPPYRMALPELKELKEQSQELFDKGFIRPSVLPWGAPVLFPTPLDADVAIYLANNYLPPQNVIVESSGASM
ncbi:uncharacterized protein [Nicotiana tomentosiformis]|uniref:uncharacterized protein n=1 Tax=Nicotiana tomentosiformis TaxID=4098 RepID=UPI00388CB8E6